MGLILASSVAIEAERQGKTAEEFVTQIIQLTGNQGAAFSSIGFTELVHGIYRAQSEAAKVRRRQFVEELWAAFTIYPYTAETASLAGRIDGQQAAAGITIPFADMLIGATALSLDFAVLTKNPRHFRLIPGLRVLSL